MHRHLIIRTARTLAALALLATSAWAHAGVPAPCDYLDRHSAARLAGRALDAPTSKLREFGLEGDTVHTCVWKVEGDGPGTLEIAIRRSADDSRNAQNIREMRAVAAFTHPQVRAAQVARLGDYAAFRHSVSLDHASLVVMEGSVMVHISGWQLHMGPDQRPMMIAAIRKILRSEALAAASAQARRSAGELHSSVRSGVAD